MFFLPPNKKKIGFPRCDIAAGWQTGAKSLWLLVKKSLIASWKKDCFLKSLWLLVKKSTIRPRPPSPASSPRSPPAKTGLTQQPASCYFDLCSFFFSLCLCLCRRSSYFFTLAFTRIFLASYWIRIIAKFQTPFHPTCLPLIQFNWVSLAGELGVWEKPWSKSQGFGLTSDLFPTRPENA